MFDSLGLESEERDAQKKHCHGRRHIPQDSGNKNDFLMQYDAETLDCPAVTYSRSQDSIPSAGLTVTPVTHGGYKPKDNLNLFSWQEHGEVPKFRRGRGRVNIAEEVSNKRMHDRGPLLHETDEQIRNRESQKFSMCTNARFLGFEGNKPCQQKRAQADRYAAPSATGDDIYNNYSNRDKLPPTQTGMKILSQTASPGVSKTADAVDGFPGLSLQHQKRTGRRVFF